MPWEVIVVGAGAAGLLAATRAAERGRATLLLEKNRKPGAKILMSGGTRCNITHHTDARGIVAAYGHQGHFLHSALAALSPADVVALFEAEGVVTKVEDTGKIFPASDKATDVLAALRQRLDRSGCQLSLGEPLLELNRDEDGFQLVTPAQTHRAHTVIVTTGGQSYPGCGTTGDAYRWLADLGHTIIPPRPALTPITSHAAWVLELKGVTIPDVHLRVVAQSEKGSDPLRRGQKPNEIDSPPKGQTPFRTGSQDVMAQDPTQLPTDAKRGKKPRPLDQRRGSLLFTHFGLSGPVALDVSRTISGHPAPATLHLECDFLPARTADEIADELAREAAADGKKQVLGILARFVPRRLAESFFQRLGLPSELRGAELSKHVRRQLVDEIKQTRIPVSGTRGFKKAEVTAGGVALREVDSSTMQSKLVPGLYLAGEVLDLDGPIGGFNFQAAFSTAWLAGSHV